MGRSAKKAVFGKNWAKKYWRNKKYIFFWTTINEQCWADELNGMCHCVSCIYYLLDVRSGCYSSFLVAIEVEHILKHNELINGMSKPN